MGRKGAYVVLGLSGFLLTTAVLVNFYMYPRLAVVPLDQSSVSHAIGENMTYFDKGSLSEKVDTLTTTIHVIGDVTASEDQGHNIAVWNEGTSTTTSAGDVIAAGTFKAAIDRTSGAAVACCDSQIDGQSNTFAGQVFKFPFHMQKDHAYPYYDTDLRTAVPFTYDGTTTIDGLTTYRMVQDIPPTMTSKVRLPSRLVGAKAGSMVSAQVWTTNHRLYYAEPETGVLMQVDENPLTTIRYKGEDKITATKGTHVSFPDNEVQANVDQYGPKGQQLHILRVWVPLVGLILGLMLGGIGLFLVLAGRRQHGQHAEKTQKRPATVPS